MFSYHYHYHKTQKCTALQTSRCPSSRTLSTSKPRVRCGCELKTLDTTALLHILFPNDSIYQRPKVIKLHVPVLASGEPPPQLRHVAVHGSIGQAAEGFTAECGSVTGSLTYVCAHLHSPITPRHTAYPVFMPLFTVNRLASESATVRPNVEM
jgi:hypothetical protein